MSEPKLRRSAEDLDEETLWRRMLLDRNLAPHTYDEGAAREVYERVREYAPAIRKAYELLEGRYGELFD